MKRFIYILPLCFFILFCSCDRERIVDKTKLLGHDYRLFQGTVAWPLAKAVEDGDINGIRRIVAENPEALNIQDSIYGSTLLMLTIINHQFDSFKELLSLNADVNIYDTFSGESAIITACES